MVRVGSPESIGAGSLLTHRTGKPAQSVAELVSGD